VVPPPTPAATEALIRPPGRRIAAPAERIPDGPVAETLTETGSHARILEPIADPPVAAAAAAPAPAPPVIPPKPPQQSAAPVKPVRPVKAEKPVKVEKPAQAPAPAPRAKRREARPKVDRPTARSAARAARAATAAPAAKQAAREAAAAAAAPVVVHAPVPGPAVLSPSVVDPAIVNPAALRPAAARRAQVREKVTTSTTTALTENQSWVVLLVLGAAAVAAERVAPGLPDLVRYLGGGVVSCTLAWGLAVRTGGRPVWATSLTALLAALALGTQWPAALSGAAVGTAVLAAMLAFMVTKPAATFAIAIREVLLATAVAWIGGVGVLGYGDNSDLSTDRFGYVVFALSLIGAFALVYRLGAGLHGLGRRGYAVAGGAALILFIAMAYTEAISQYGSREIVDSLDSLRSSVRSSLGAVPHPIMAVLGYPALVWGVFMRARRRQGWWVCAFGVAATAPCASRLIASDLGVRSVVLGAAYSLVIGLVIGYVVIRGEQTFTGNSGRRARRDEEAEAHRPEPLRLRPLH
jgi:hypothetical protein